MGDADPTNADYYRAIYPEIINGQDSLTVDNVTFPILKCDTLMADGVDTELIKGPHLIFDCTSVNFGNANLTGNFPAGGGGNQFSLVGGYYEVPTGLKVLKDQSAHDITLKEGTVTCNRLNSPIVETTNIYMQANNASLKMI